MVEGLKKDYNLGKSYVIAIIEYLIPDTLNDS